jgi:hypothetical protein
MRSVSERRESQDRSVSGDESDHDHQHFTLKRLPVAAFGVARARVCLVAAPVSATRCNALPGSGHSGCFAIAVLPARRGHQTAAVGKSHLVQLAPRKATGPQCETLSGSSPDSVMRAARSRSLMCWFWEAEMSRWNASSSVRRWRSIRMPTAWPMSLRLPMVARRLASWSVLASAMEARLAKDRRDEFGHRAEGGRLAGIEVQGGGAAAGQRQLTGQDAAYPEIASLCGE